jgi:methanogenic corrinoid protein MtbC1
MAAGPGLAGLIRDNEASIVAAVSEGICAQPQTGEMAQQRMVTAHELASQVAGNWVKVVASDLMLGDDVALRENLEWSVRFARGQNLTFSAGMYHLDFDGICDQVSRLAEGAEQSATLDAYRVRGHALIDQVLSRGPATAPSPDDDLDAYLRHLLEGEDEACLQTARGVAEDLPGLHKLYVGLIAPSQYRVGDLWESGQISVATEHMATATNAYVAVSTYAPLARSVAGAPKALIACTPDELHDLGAHLVANLLECDGWDVDFLGASMPLRDLLDAAGARKPRVIGLSAALSSHLGSVRETVRALRESLGSDCPPIVVGGNAFRGDPSLWRAVGADRCASDGSDAVAVLREFR